MMDFKLQNILIYSSKILVTVHMKGVEVASYAAPISILFQLLFPFFDTLYSNHNLNLWTTLYGDHDLPLL